MNEFGVETLMDVAVRPSIEGEGDDHLIAQLFDAYAIGVEEVNLGLDQGRSGKGLVETGLGRFAAIQSTLDGRRHEIDPTIF